MVFFFIIIIGSDFADGGRTGAITSQSLSLEQGYHGNR